MNHPSSSRIKPGILLVAALMLAGAKLYAQGSVIFCNSNTTLVTNSLTGQPVAPGDGVQAALYWSPVGTNAFIQIGSSTSIGTPLAGLFAAGTRLTGTNTPGGASGQFQVRAWGGGYATYELAAQAVPGVLLGQSAILTVSTGNPTNLPPTPAAALLSGGFQSFSVSLTSVDIGLRAFDGTSIIKLAAAPTSPPVSPFLINKNGTNASILLVATNAPNASKFRIQTASGIKAIQQLP